MGVVRGIQRQHTPAVANTETHEKTSAPGYEIGRRLAESSPPIMMLKLKRREVYRGRKREEGSKTVM